MSQKLVGACIIGQSGGPTAVINASAYGVIRTALDAPEITNVYGAAHGIKGVLLNMGLTQEGLTAKKVEESVRAGASPESLRQEAESLLLTTGSILEELHVALGGENI